MVIDLAGNTIHEGDQIAAAVRQYNRGELRIGTVVGIGKRGENDTLQIAWERESPGRTLGRTSTIEAHHARFIKIKGV